jgi:hypothetical protein
MNLKNNLELENITRAVAVKRITALWALSETTLGGILHALHIPITGIFVGGIAIIFITLIAYFSEHNVSIIKATIIVLIVKGIVSPYTPIAAYISVLLQGMLGQFLFANKKHLSLSALILSITTLLFFGFQKIIIYTLVFGRTLWQSIDTYANFIIEQLNLGGQNVQTIHFSFILISIYILIHLTAGIFWGILAGRIPNWITASVNNYDYNLANIKSDISSYSFTKSADNKKSFKKGKRVFLFLIIPIGVIILSYFIPSSELTQPAEVALMIFRALVITFIWYFYLAPLLLNYSKKYLKKQQNVYTEEVDEILTLLPHLKTIIFYCWAKSSKHRALQKYRYFLTYSLIALLLTNFNFE